MNTRGGGGGGGARFRILGGQGGANFSLAKNRSELLPPIKSIGAPSKIIDYFFLIFFWGVGGGGGGYESSLIILLRSDLIIKGESVIYV